MRNSELPVYALIPARSGSDRFPNKNTTRFHGRPLAEWTIDLATKSRLFDKIYLSTDIESLRSSCPSEIDFIERPPGLRGSEVTLLEVIQDAVYENNWRDDALLCLLLVTAPLRIQSDISEAIRLFETGNRERSVVSVSQNLQPPALSWTKENGVLHPLVDSDDPKHTRKQNHQKTYMFNDILVIDSIGNWKNLDRNLFGKNPIPLECPADRCMPIDYEIQFRLAEALFPPFDERYGHYEWKI